MSAVPHSDSTDTLRLLLSEASDAVEALAGSPAMSRTCRSKNTAMELRRMGLPGRHTAHQSNLRFAC